MLRVTNWVRVFAIFSSLFLTWEISAPRAADIPTELSTWLVPQRWQRDVERPVLSLGAMGDFDDQHIFAPAVARENEHFLMWYSGSRGTPANRVFRLGLATSTDGDGDGDGKHFDKHPGNPVLQFSDGAHSVLTPTLLRQGDGSVMKENGQFRMWISSTVFGKGGLHTLHETKSADGIHWTEPSPALLEHAYCPTVLKTDRGYEMWFSDVSRRPWVIRHASSSDGTRWQVTRQPVLYLSQSWEAEVLVYPCVLRIGDAYLMWYGSYDQAVRRETTAIGFAASRDGIHWHKFPQNPVLRPDPQRPWESNYVGSGCVMRLADGTFRYWYASRKQPPFRNLYFAINTARWSGPATRPVEELPAPDFVKKYLKRCEDAKLASLAVQQAAIDSLQRIPSPTEADNQRLSLAQGQYNTKRDQPAELLRMPLPPNNDDVGRLEVGDNSRLRSVDVLETIDDDEAIWRVWSSSTDQAADEPTFVDLWVQGIDSKSSHATPLINRSQVFHVVGNKLFDTTCGKRSLPLLEPIDIDRYRK